MKKILILFALTMAVFMPVLAQDKTPATTVMKNGGGIVQINPNGSITITPKPGQPLNLNGVIQSDGEVRAQSYASIASAVAAIGTAQKSLVVTTAMTVSGSTTIPANVSLIVRGDGMITATAPLSIEGFFDAPLKQVLATSGSGAITLKPGKTRYFYPEWYGAKGNATGATGGGADDTAPLQATLNTVPRGGGVEIVLLGAYRVTSSLNLLNHSGSGDYRLGIRMVGTNTGDPAQIGVGNYWSSALVWDGASGGTLLNLHTRGCELKGIVFAVAAGKTCGVGVDVDRASGAALTDTSAREDVFVDCLWIGSQSGEGTTHGTLIDGVRIGVSGNPQNNDFLRYRHCNWVGLAHSGVYFAQTDFQAKHHTFNDCTFLDAPYGIYCDTGSFETDHCGFYNLSTTAIFVRIALDAISIRDTNSESCAQFFNNPSPVGSEQPLTISGGRIALERGGGITQPFISYKRNGVFTLQGVVFDSPNTYPDNNFLIQAYCFPPNYSHVIATGNVFPNPNPFRFSGSAGDTSGRVVLLSNSYFTSDGTLYPLNDQFLNVNTPPTWTIATLFSRLGVQTVDGEPTSSSPQVLGGCSSPEAVVVAPAGSIYLRCYGELYLKTSGSGNTGWTLK
jgi:hypothetical protein